MRCLSERLGVFRELTLNDDSHSHFLYTKRFFQDLIYNPLQEQRPQQEPIGEQNPDLIASTPIPIAAIYWNGHS